MAIAKLKSVTIFRIHFALYILPVEDEKANQKNYKYNHQMDEILLKFMPQAIPLTHWNRKFFFYYIYWCYLMHSHWIFIVPFGITHRYIIPWSYPHQNRRKNLYSFVVVVVFVYFRALYCHHNKLKIVQV